MKLYTIQYRRASIYTGEYQLNQVYDNVQALWHNSVNTKCKSVVTEILHN